MRCHYSFLALGTQIDANASKHRNVRYDRAGELVEQLKADIGELLKQAEQAEYVRKLQVRERRSGKRKGKKPKPLDESVPEDRQMNLTDPDSALMRKNKGSEYRQSYNAQALVSTDGSQLIVGARLTDAASDRGVVADVTSVPSKLGRVNRILADGGYAAGEEVDELGRRTLEVLVALEWSDRRRYNFRPRSAEKSPPRQSMPWVQRMKARMKEERNRKRYRLRKQTVEPVFGIIKEAMRFRRFQLRGLDKAQGEWNLVCLAYNCKRIHRLMMV